VRASPFGATRPSDAVGPVGVLEVVESPPAEQVDVVHVSVGASFGPALWRAHSIG